MIEIIVNYNQKGINVFVSPEQSKSDKDSKFDPTYTQNPAHTTVPNIVGWIYSK